MKKIKKLIGIITLILVLLTGNVYALTIDPQERVNIIFDDVMPYHYEAEEKVNYKMLEYNKSALYTLNRNNDIVIETFTNAQIYKDEICERIIQNGYPMKTHEQLGLNNKKEAYFATQEAIYAYLEQKDINKYIAENEEGKRILECSKQILEKSEKDEVIFSEIDSQWKEEQTNAKYKYKRYKITLNSNIKNATIGLEEPLEVQICTQENETVSNVKNGDIIKIMIPKGINLDFRVKIYYEKESVTPYKISNSTNTNKQYLTWKEEKISNQKLFEISFKDAGHIIIINYDNETKKRMPGNIFSILYEDQQVMYENLETDEEGMIQTFLPKGKYFLKQTFVKDGYSLANGILSFEVKNIEDINLNIYNSKPTITQDTKENTQINVTQEDKKVVENNVTNVTNVHTTNIEKEIIDTTNETNFENINYFLNTNHLKNITNIEKENTYSNNIWKESISNKKIEGENITTNMTRDEYITYIDFIKIGSFNVPNLPVAIKQ